MWFLLTDTSGILFLSFSHCILDDATSVRTWYLGILRSVCFTWNWLVLNFFYFEFLKITNYLIDICQKRIVSNNMVFWGKIDITVALSKQVKPIDKVHTLELPVELSHEFTRHLKCFGKVGLCRTLYFRILSQSTKKKTIRVTCFCWNALYIDTYPNINHSWSKLFILLQSWKHQNVRLSSCIPAMWLCWTFFYIQSKILRLFYFLINVNESFRKVDIKSTLWTICLKCFILTMGIINCLPRY